MSIFKLRVSVKAPMKAYTFDLKGTEIKCEGSVILLGISIDHMHKMNKNVS